MKMKYRMRWFDAEWHDTEYTNYDSFSFALRRLIRSGLTVEISYA